VAFFLQRFFYSFGHLQLSAAEFIRGVSVGKEAAGGEELVEGGGPYSVFRVWRRGLGP